jgi:hypothetical protein
VTLNELLSKYFDAVDINIEYKNDEEDARIRLDIYVKIAIYDNNKGSTNITKFVSIENSIVKKIINANN